MSQNITKIIEEIEKMPVIELADLVKALEDKFGVSASMPMGVASTAGASAKAVPTEEKTEFKVTLKEAGAQKIKVIKALRTVTSLALREAKDLVEAAPAVVAESATKEDAQKMKTVLEEAGATVELA